MYSVAMTQQKYENKVIIIVTAYSTHIIKNELKNIKLASFLKKVKNKFRSSVGLVMYYLMPWMLSWLLSSSDRLSPCKTITMVTWWSVIPYYIYSYYYTLNS